MSDFSFDHTTTDFHLGNARTLAHAAKLAYSDSDEIEQTVNSWGLDRYRFLDNGSTQGFVAGSENVLLIVFRGTEPKAEDFLVDALALLTDGPEGRVHVGFNEALKLVWEPLNDAINSFRDADQPVWIAGHSLGAALATLAAAKLAIEESKVADGVYTFGSPRVGDETFAGAYDRHLRERTFRFANNNDTVCRVPIPLRLFPYQHVGVLKHIDRNGRLREKISWWRRLLDRLFGRFQDVGQLGTKGLKDHSMKKYVEHLENISSS